MANIEIVGDFLQSDLRPGELYQLNLAGVEITEAQFRDVISELNQKFLYPRIVFSAVLEDSEIKLWYSTGGKGATQGQVVLAIDQAFSPYQGQIIYQESPGEVPGAVPLTTPREEAPILSLDWLRESYDSMVESISQKSGLPTWSILPISGLALILLIAALKTKPIIVLK